MCAGNEKEDGRIRTCMGDSGGPLACIHNGKMVIVGIASYTHNDCDAVSPKKYDFPSMFTRVSYYTDWIKKYTVCIHFFFGDCIIMSN